MAGKSAVSISRYITLHCCLPLLRTVTSTRSQTQRLKAQQEA